MWKKIETEADLQGLMNDYTHFHDSCIRDVHIDTIAYVNDQRAMVFGNSVVFTLLFQQQFGNNPVLELKFEGVKRFNIDPLGSDGMDVITDATFRKEGELYLWADEPNWKPEDEDAIWISAQAVSWRYRPDLAGNVSRLKEGPVES